MTTGFWLEHVGRGGKYSLRKEKQILKRRLSSCEHVGLGCFRTSEEMLGRQVDTWTQRSGEIGQSAACVGGSPGIIEWGETGSLFRSALPLFRRFTSSVSSHSAGSRVLTLVLAPSRHNPSLSVIL